MNQGLKKILVVDDEEISRKVISRILQQAHYEVETANDGEQALSMLQADPNSYDTVILDFVMPNMDGLTLLKTLKADPGNAHLPVIMLTTVDTQDEIFNAVAAGAYDYLNKPVNKNALIELVGKAVETL